MACASDHELLYNELLLTWKLLSINGSLWFLNILESLSDITRIRLTVKKYFITVDLGYFPLIETIISLPFPHSLHHKCDIRSLFLQ